MDINKEKEYIYMMLQSIHEERRRLTEMASGFKNRLDELNRLEMQGIEELSVKGWVDLHNQAKKEVAATNVARETAFLEERLQSMVRQTMHDEFSRREEYIKGQEKYGPFDYGTASEPAQSPFPSMSETTRIQEEKAQKQESVNHNIQPSKLNKLESVQQETYIDESVQKPEEKQQNLSDEDWRRIQQNLNNKKQKVLNKIEEDSKPKQEETPAAKENKALNEHNRTQKRERKYDTNRIFSLIIQVLKENGVPLKAEDIHRQVEELYGEPIDKTNFTNNMMHRLFKKDKRVTRPQRAYYQYDFSASL
ncbi:hypothetical protein CN918_25560 [Priestia megaterium]|nr:hypothetical protein CN918_25560 [Priestia megaterium]